MFRQLRQEERDREREESEILKETIPLMAIKDTLTLTASGGKSHWMDKVPFWLAFRVGDRGQSEDAQSRER